MTVPCLPEWLGQIESGIAVGLMQELEQEIGLTPGRTDQGRCC